MRARRIEVQAAVDELADTFGDRTATNLVDGLLNGDDHVWNHQTGVTYTISDDWWAINRS
jgi:hypothetical protein